MMTFYLLLQIASITALITICARKSHSQKPKRHLGDEKTGDMLYDETQQTVELQEDPLANVRLLTPSLPGGCNDENAAREAANRHKTNSYFPELEIQSVKIVDSTTPDELRTIVERLPPHPPQRYRKDIKERSLEERYSKWKDIHVSWHEKGLVFLIRSSDSCRAKDDGPGDTIDSPYPEDEDDEKINSEMPISENCDNRPIPSKAPSRGRERSTQRSTAKAASVVTKSSKRKSSKASKKSSKVSMKEKKLDRTQQETALSAVTPLTPEEPKSEHYE